MRKMLDEEKQMFRQIRLLSPLLSHIDLRQAFRKAVRAVESAVREECAKVAAENAMDLKDDGENDYNRACVDIAAAIREGK